MAVVAPPSSVAPPPSLAPAGGAAAGGAATRSPTTPPASGRSCPLRPQPRHLQQPIGLLLDHAQGVGLEVGGDALGHPGTDALDEARAQVAADALDGGRQHGGVAGHLELLAVLGVALPAPFEAHAL